MTKGLKVISGRGWDKRPLKVKDRGKCAAHKQGFPASPRVLIKISNILFLFMVLLYRYTEIISNIFLHV